MRSVQHVAVCLMKLIRAHQTGAGESKNSTVRDQPPSLAGQLDEYMRGTLNEPEGADQVTTMRARSWAMQPPADLELRPLVRYNFRGNLVLTDAGEEYLDWLA